MRGDHVRALIRETGLHEVHARASAIPVIASGGITNLGDVRALLAVAGEGICGAITGRAIYEGTLDVAEAQRLCDGSYRDKGDEAAGP